MSKPFDFTQPITKSNKSNFLESLISLIEEMDIADYRITPYFHEVDRPIRCGVLVEKEITSSLFADRNMVYRKMGDVYKFIFEGHEVRFIQTNNIDFTSFWYMYPQYDEEKRVVRNVFLEELCNHFSYPIDYHTENLEVVGEVASYVKLQLEIDGLFLLSSSPNEETKKFITQDWNRIAVMLFGRGARATDLKTLESILSFIDSRKTKIDDILKSAYCLTKSRIASKGYDSSLIPVKYKS